MRARFPLFGVVAAVVGASLSAGCVTTEAKVRVITAAPVLREQRGAPEGIRGAINVDVGADAATDAELKAANDAVRAALADAIATADTRDGWRKGELSVVRARIKAAPGREQHRYVADCRLRFSVDGDGKPEVVGETDGEVLRLVRARSLSVIELEALTAEVKANGGRIPLLQAEDVTAAVVDACTAAFAAFHDVRPGDDADGVAGQSRAARQHEAQEQRRRALARLEKPKNPDEEAAALIDLAGVGALDDAVVVKARLYDDNALVARAAGVTFDVLCAGQKALRPTSTSCLKPEPPPPPPPPPAAPVDDETDDETGPIRAPTTEAAAPATTDPTTTTTTTTPTTPTEAP